MNVYAIELETMDGQEWYTTYYHGYTEAEAVDACHDDHKGELVIASIRTLA